jgi:PAS domain S-box-containing protein
VRCGFAAAVLAALVRRAFDHPQDQEARAQLREWLGKVEAHHEYDRVFLLDARGVERMSVPESRTPVSSVIARGTSEILRSRSAVFQDFYRDEYDRRAYLTVLVPVREGHGGSRVLGIVGLRIDPEVYLYPFIRRWPVPSRTSEVVIARRDGTDVLFLNELRFQAGTALKLRVPLARREVLAVKAALGQTGIVEGHDYRGVPAVAALTAVPGSPWFLVARMDAAEVNAPLRGRLWMTILLVGGLVAAAAVGVGALWRERHLRHLRERYEAEAVRRAHETLLAAVGEGVQVHDAEGRITSINESALRILGRTREDVAAGLLRSWDIVHEDGTPFPADAYPVARTLRSGESVSGVVMGVPRPDGGVAWLKVSSRPLLRPGETKPYGAVATFADVSAYKETVEQLAAMTQQLWQTARLATMGELAASVAHELNNPLGTVNLRVESLLAQVPAGDPKRRALEVIEQEAERMGNLVAGLLQFSRRSHRQVSTLDLREEVKASLDLVRYHLRNRRVAVELDGAADVVLVHADRQQLRQLFLNLFTNASDAMPEGGRLRIRVTRGDGNVVVEVADTGVGIPPENLERIFEPFFTTKPEGKGTGLGLAICRRIAQEHGGTLDLTSEVGTRTTVRVTLPAAGAEGESES